MMKSDFLTQHLRGSEHTQLHGGRRQCSFVPCPLGIPGILTQLGPVFGGTDVLVVFIVWFRFRSLSVPSADKLKS